jgi:hypothetical protein
MCQREVAPGHSGAKKPPGSMTSRLTQQKQSRRQNTALSVAVAAILIQTRRNNNEQVLLPCLYLRELLIDKIVKRRGKQLHWCSESLCVSLKLRNYAAPQFLPTKQATKTAVEIFFSFFLEAKSCLAGQRTLRQRTNHRPGPTRDIRGYREDLRAFWVRADTWQERKRAESSARVKRQNERKYLQSHPRALHPTSQAAAIPQQV